MMAVALALTACSGEDNTIETSQTGNPKELSKVKTIAYSVTVNGGNATTRATVDDNNKTLRFAAGDVLYIASDSRADLKGALTLKAGDAGKTSGATFEGSLTYTGDAPADDLTLKATLVGSSNAGIGITDGKVTGITYPTDAFCSSVNDAVEKYSLLTGTSTYAARSFSLSQSTAFLNFAVRLTGSVTAGTNVTATVKNGATTLSAATVTAADVSGTVTAQFVLPVAANTVLSGATVTINNLPAVSFGGDAAKTLSAKVYNVARGIVDLSTLTAAYTAQNGDLLTGTLANNVKISIANDATVTLDGVNINPTSSAGIICKGNANIILSGDNYVSGSKDNPAVQAAHNDSDPDKEFTLTISGSGSLTATGGSDAAGIGSGFKGECGNITISGGTVTATGGTYAAGIGTGYESSGCGAISIKNTVTQVTATKGDGFNVGSFNCIGSGESGGTVGDISFGSTIVYNSTTEEWTQNPMVNGTYGGLNLVISKTVYEGDTWTLTPKTTN